MPYTPTVYVNAGAPPINASNLNKGETQIGAVTTIAENALPKAGGTATGTLVLNSVAAAQSIRDDSTSTPAIAINGTHTGALVVANGAGKSVFGATSVASAARVKILATSDTECALLLRSNSATQSTAPFRVENSANSEIFSVGVAGNLGIADAANLVLGTTTGTKIGTATTQKIGFWNAAPVVQQTVTGSRGGNAALASLLTALATEGLIVDSSTA